jgi:hypothetical protein
MPSVGLSTVFPRKSRLIETGRRGATLAALAAIAGLGMRADVLAATGTPPGTAIVNSATPSYSDRSGKAFTSVSNTVTTTVRSAPSLAIVAGETQKTVPGGRLTSAFVATNTGNGGATPIVACELDTGATTWATYTTASRAVANVTSGLDAPATDTSSGTTFTANTAGSYAFAASIGGTGLILAPGCSGPITFAVTVGSA